MNKENIKTGEKTNIRKNWIDPNVSLTYEEFIEGIREAERGPFYTVEEAMEKFEQWRKSRSNKEK